MDWTGTVEQYPFILVAAGLADKVEVQLAYAIGVADPVSVLVETFGTSNVDPAALSKPCASISSSRREASSTRST